MFKRATIVTSYQHESITKLVPGFVTLLNDLEDVLIDESNSMVIRLAAEQAWKKLSKYHNLADSDACIIPLSMLFCCNVFVIDKSQFCIHQLR